MAITDTANRVDDAVKALKEMSAELPAVAVILGSGVTVLEDLPESKTASYKDIFGIAPGVAGHAGTISLGRVGQMLVAVLRGRFHLYEGYQYDVVTLPTRVLCQWGVRNLFVTNAAGGMNQSFNVGDLMVLNGLRDLLNPELAKTGLLPPLKEPIIDCRNELTELLLQTGEKLAAASPRFRPLRAGTYAALLGPTYETLAEIEMLKKLKADAVGMSTAPELATVKGTQTRAAAVSVVTNVWSPDVAIGGHEEVLEAAKEASERLDLLFRSAITDMFA